MKRWTRAIVAVGVAVASLSLAGCDNPNDVEYRVLDRFHIADYNQIEDGPKKPPGDYFLWVKAWGTEQSSTPASKDLYIDKKLWDTCWTGDKYTVRYVGRDTCVRTPESIMPTTLRPDYPELQKKMEKELERRRTASPVPSTGAHRNPTVQTTPKESK